MNIERKYEAKLTEIPRPGAGCHASLLGAANLGVIAGRPDADILHDIRVSIPAGDRNIPDKEILDAIAKARREVSPATADANYRLLQRHQEAKKPLIDGPAYLKKLVARGDGAGPVDLWEISPYRPEYESDYRDALAVLDLYDAGEYLFIGDKYDTTVRPVSEWRSLIECGKAPWPHIMPNPVTGRQHPDKDGKPSFRCDNAVCSFRYVIVEFDTILKPNQFAFWYSIIQGQLLPVALILDSGGKSLHAWVRVDFPDRQTWDQQVKARFYGDTGVFTSMGADRACQNPSRLSRLPGHYRMEKQQMQTLLYRGNINAQ